MATPGTQDVDGRLLRDDGGTDTLDGARLADGLADALGDGLTDDGARLGELDGAGAEALGERLLEGELGAGELEEAAGLDRDTGGLELLRARLLRTEEAAELIAAAASLLLDGEAGGAADCTLNSAAAHTQGIVPLEVQLAVCPAPAEISLYSLLIGWLLLDSASKISENPVPTLSALSPPECPMAPTITPSALAVNELVVCVSPLPSPVPVPALRGELVSQPENSLMPKLVNSLPDGVTVTVGVVPPVMFLQYQTPHHCCALVVAVPCLATACENELVPLATVLTEGVPLLRNRVMAQV